MRSDRFKRIISISLTVLLVSALSFNAAFADSAGAAGKTQLSADSEIPSASLSTAEVNETAAETEAESESAAADETEALSGSEAGTQNDPAEENSEASSDNSDEGMLKAAGASGEPDTSTAGTEENSSGTSDSSETATPATYIIKVGDYYYFTDPETGEIVKKAGFVTDVDGKMYYIRKGVLGINRWTIITSKTFKVSGKYYRAGKTGAIKTGVYKWSGKYYYSKPSTGQWIKKEKIVKWNGNKYYIQSGGVIFTGGIFSFNNIPYSADSKGVLTDIPIPKAKGKGKAVIKVAKEQVGIMTGKTYWTWYFKTLFVDTDRTPWCGAFVAWCYNEAGLYDKVSVATKYGNLGYVPTYSRYANKYGKWVKNSKAKSGDIIVFGSNTHVGLVEGISDGYIVTIEGNAGPTAIIGCGKPGAVVRKVYEINSSKIKGVIRVL